MHSSVTTPAFLLLFIVNLVCGDVDNFGIIKQYQSVPGTISWTSAHWNNGIERTVRYDDDPYDPTGWTEDHSSGTDGFRIDGKGVMTMSGEGPRFHINSLDSSNDKKQFFRNIEFTAYYMRKGPAGKNWGGMVVGVRSGPLGHASPGGSDCDATTYYARFRNDGKWDFEKELKHPGSSYWSGSGYGKQDPLWNGAPLPPNRWIGMKYMVYNIDSNSHVRLTLFIDTLSNGTPVNGGDWRMVGTVTDSGTWPSGDVSGCSHEQSSIILEGNGTVLIRTDGDTAVYKMVSVREIIPETTASLHPTHSCKLPRTGRSLMQHIVLDAHAEYDYSTASQGRQFTIQGRRCAAGRIHGRTGAGSAASGVFILLPDRTDNSR